MARSLLQGYSFIPDDNDHDIIFDDIIKRYIIEYDKRFSEFLDKIVINVNLEF